MLTLQRFQFPEAPTLTGDVSLDVQAIAAAYSELRRAIVGVFDALDQPGALTITQASLDLQSVVRIKPEDGKTALLVGTDASDNGTDYMAIWVDQVLTEVDRYSIGIGCVNVFAPAAAVTATQCISVAGDFWGWFFLNTASSATTETCDELTGLSAQVSAGADVGKTATIALARGLKVTAPTEAGAGTTNWTDVFGVDVEDVTAIGATGIAAAYRMDNNNAIVSRNAAGSGHVQVAKVNASDAVVIGDSTKALNLEGTSVTGRGYTLQGNTAVALDPADSTTYYMGQWLPSTTAGINRIYIPKAGVIKVAYLHIMTLGTSGSGETSTVSIRVNNTTDTTLSAAVTTNAVNQVFSNTGLSITVARGDYIELKWATPAWATNPTQVYFWPFLYIE